VSAEWLYPAPWLPLTAPLTSGSACRTPELLERVVAQFGLDTAARWQKHVATLADGQQRVETYCNVWLTDATKAQGCEVPRWWQRGALLVQLSANEQQRWLQESGPQHGWRPCTVAQAQLAANMGHPAVATWLNPELGHSGHVALFVPDRGERGLFIAQAGLTCFSRGTLSSGFGARNVLCFTHD
jgi:hypothetical protein